MISLAPMLPVSDVRIGRTLTNTNQVTVEQCYYYYYYYYY